MTVINFDEIIGKGNNYITNNIFCIKHPTNCLITGKSNSGKTNILMNLIAQNCIYDKIHIFTNNSNDDKYIWLKNKFKNDVYIYINEVNFDKIDKNKINLVVFDDLVFSDKKISTFFTQSRKINVSCVFIAHSFFKVDKLLRDNLDYIISTKLDKREITSLYNSISLDLTLKQFQEINNNLKRYDFIIIDKFNDIDFMKIRKNFNNVLIK